MKISTDIMDVLNNNEKIALDLRALYRQYGYQPFMMNKFEEYDLYAQNKNFLISNNVITFTDSNGKLMALKPDVTLSIIKNFKEQAGTVDKLYYNENVYRMDAGSHEYKEIMQTGLECIGAVDLYAMSEVIMLAIRSLMLINDRFILDISHMGFVSGLLDELALDELQTKELLTAVKAKNIAETKHLCAELSLSEELTAVITEMTSLYAPFEQGITMLEKLSVNPQTAAAVAELKGIYEILKDEGCAQNVYLDFSLTNDMDYYNGVIFRGYVDGLPSGVLAGGRYDNLVRRFGKDSSAIGFAVYLDLLERMNEQTRQYDVDVLMLYDQDTDMCALAQAVKMLTDNGQSVRVQRTNVGKLRYRQLLAMKNRGLEILETND